MQFHVASCILISDSLFVPQNLSVGKNFALPVKVNFTGKLVKQFYQFFTGKLTVKSPPYCRILSPYYPGSVPLAGAACTRAHARLSLLSINGAGAGGQATSPLHQSIFFSSPPRSAPAPFWSRAHLAPSGVKKRDSCLFYIITRSSSSLPLYQIAANTSGIFRQTSPCDR